MQTEAEVDSFLHDAGWETAQREPLAASAEHRLALLRLAVAGRPHLRINPAEIRRGGKTYTIDTLEALPDGIDYYWIFGADQLGNFCTWHRWKDIVERVRLVVVERPGTPLEIPPALRHRLHALGRELIELPFEPMPVSASAIRDRIACGLPISGMVEVAVEHYIKQNNLYQPPLC